MADAAPAAIGTVAVAADGLAPALRAVADGGVPALITWPGAVLAPGWQDFAQAVARELDGDARLAGATLAVPRLRPGTRVPFVIAEDGFDTVLVQRADPAAVLLTARAASAPAMAGVADEAGLSAWLARTGACLLAPRTPLAHDGGAGDGLQRLFPVAARSWRLGLPDRAIAMYDHALEILPEAAVRLCPALAGAAFAVDLWGEREEAGEGLLLSSRPCAAPRIGFPLEMVPPEANLTAPGTGDFFSLGRAGDFGPMTAERREALFRHATRYNAMGDYAAQLLGPLRRLAGRR